MNSASSIDRLVARFEDCRSQVPLIELSFTNPPNNPTVPSSHEVGDCRVGRIDTSSDTFVIQCNLDGITPVEGATLTYISS